MKIALPCFDQNGIHAWVCDHFGCAPWFTIYDSQSRECAVFSNGDQYLDENGRCNPHAALRGHTVDTVVCRGLGRRALTSLHDMGIQVFRVEAGEVGEAIAEFEAGKAKKMTLDDVKSCPNHPNCDLA